MSKSTTYCRLPKLAEWLLPAGDIWRSRRAAVPGGARLRPAAASGASRLSRIMVAVTISASIMVPARWPGLERAPAAQPIRRRRSSWPRWSVAPPSRSRRIRSRAWQASDQPAGRCGHGAAGWYLERRFAAVGPGRAPPASRSLASRPTRRHDRTTSSLARSAVPSRCERGPSALRCARTTVRSA